MADLDTRIDNNFIDATGEEAKEGGDMTFDPEGDPVESGLERHIQAQEQAEIAKRGGKPPAAAGPGRSRAKPLWKGFVAVCVRLVLLDVALPYSLARYAIRESHRGRCGGRLRVACSFQAWSGWLCTCCSLPTNEGGHERNERKWPLKRKSCRFRGTLGLTHGLNTWSFAS